VADWLVGFIFRLFSGVGVEEFCSVRVGFIVNLSRNFDEFLAFYG
jgi:hypothetical protein